MSFSSFKAVKTISLAIAGMLFATPTFAAEHTVEINKTSVLRLPSPASAVVIGNPKIADISVHSSDTLLLSGRGFGTTNILAFDEFGQTIMDAEIQVHAPQTSTAIRVNSIGDGFKTYSCNPHCLPAPIIGDSGAFIAEFQGENIVSANTTATGPTLTTSVNPQSFVPPSPELQR